MKKSTYFIFAFIMILTTNTFAQRPTLEISFTSLYYGQYVSSDSIMIKNMNQGGDTMLYAPDTTLVLEYVVGITDNEGIGKNSISVSQNYPNPVTDGQTTIEVYLPEKQQLKILVVDILGRVATRYNSKLNAGKHVFTFYPGKEAHYVLSAFAGNSTQAIKITSLQSNMNASVCLQYNGNEGPKENMKSAIGNSNFTFTLGDTLRYVGYASTPAGIRASDVIDDTPLDNKTITFEIIEGIPCPGTAAITYHGQTYNTVQIFDQCWLKENMNIGIMINGDTNMKDNGIIEKYCYDNNERNCDVYGGLYQWDEMMQYITLPGVQGICPVGWHISTDEEWTQLSDSLGGGGHAGRDVKETGTSHWFSPNSASNLTGFTALPGGYRGYNSGTFEMLGEGADFFTSTEGSGPYPFVFYRSLYYASSMMGGSGSGGVWKTHGNSVRCIKD